jgi:hypothetical protein
MTVAIDDELRRRLLIYQRNEITEHHIYRALAETVDAENRQVLERLAQTELRHYGVWRRYTGIDVGPNRWTIRGYRWLSRALGFTFGVRSQGRSRSQAGDTLSLPFIERFLTIL